MKIKGLINNYGNISFIIENLSAESVYEKIDEATGFVNLTDIDELDEDDWYGFYVDALLDVIWDGINNVIEEEKISKKFLSTEKDLYKNSQARAKSIIREKIKKLEQDKFHINLKLSDLERMLGED